MSETETETETKSTTALLIDALLAKGTPVDEGQFTIDAAAAARKLSAFMYADTEVYLVPLVEALARLGCREICVDVDGEDLSIRAARVSLTKVEATLLDLYSHALGDNQDHPLGRLAVAIDMALRDPANTRVALTYSTASRSFVAVYRSGAAPTLVEANPEVIRELRILIDRSWRARVSESFAKALDYLRRAVEHAPVPVSLDGEPISQQSRAWTDLVEHEGPGYRVRVGVAPGSGGRAELWSAGICIATIKLDHRAGVVAEIELDAPRRDLSRVNVVHDACVEAALAHIAAYEPPAVEAAKPAPNAAPELGPEHAAAQGHAHDDSDEHERAARRDSTESESDPKPSAMTPLMTMIGAGLYIAGVIPGTLAMSLIVGTRGELSPLEAADFGSDEPIALAFSTVWMLMSVGWTAGLCYGGAAMVLQDRIAKDQAPKLGRNIMLATLVFALLIAMTMPAGMP